MSELSRNVRHIVLVGHCGPDAHLLRTAINRIVPAAIIEVANDDESLAPYLSANALLLINRVLDGQFDDSDGVKLIERLAKRPGRPEMVLISNHSDAQESAVAAGARHGFGKSQLYAESTVALLRKIVDST